MGSQAADASGVREASGPTGRLDAGSELEGSTEDAEGEDARGQGGGDPPVIAATLNSNKGGGWRYDADQAENLVPVPFVKAGRRSAEQEQVKAFVTEAGETWVEGDVMPTLNSFDVGDVRTTAAIVMPPHVLPDDADPLLPLGLDSNRYRAIGNAVAVPVVEWIAHRLTHYFSDTQPVTTAPETVAEEDEWILL
jgi:hypothetical protein